MAADVGRLLTTLQNSQFQKENNALYQVIAQLIRASQTYQDALIAIGVDLNAPAASSVVTPSDVVEDLDGSGDAGVSLEYSRGDHKHEYILPLHPFMFANN